MKKTLDSIIQECASRGIPVSIRPASQGKTAYEVQGFSKSGIASVYIHKGKILCETRYGNIEEIESFHELALVALEWYLNYKDRNPFEEPEPYWAEYWVEKGIMTKVTKVSYVIR